jgi:hypothetical protein
VKAATRERAEILMPAWRIGTSDAGHPLPIVAAGEKACCNAGDPLITEVRVMAIGRWP